MKNVLFLLFAFIIILVFSFCTSEMVLPVQTNDFTDELYQVDTIIIFNPDTYEETIKIVRRKITPEKQKKN